jgi:nucleotide-binding universal stress UspA family protein
MKLDNILCTIDFSKFTAQVIGHGVELARRFNARLFVFHAVYCPHDPLYGTAEFERGGEMDKQVTHYRQKIATLMKSEQIRWDAMVRVGDPVIVISTVAGQVDADLVIGATHGHSRWQRMLIGTVVERMARNLACPFLVIPGLNLKIIDEQHHKAPTIKTIVAGCDFSRETRPATDYAAGLAREFNAALHLFHAVESPINEAVVDQTRAPYGQIQQTLQERLHQRLARLVPKTDAGLQRLKTALAPGLPAEQLPSYAARQKADILVVGVRRHHKLEKLLVGSTTEAVLRHSPCPVLVVPSF